MRKQQLEKAMRELGCWPLNSLQEEWIPRIEEGQDCFLQAQTGSGKTLAFLFPAAERIDPALSSPQVLILSPTRELAAQTADTARQLTVYTDIHTACLIGGLSASKQENVLRTCPHMIIGTPGRISDLLGQGRICLSDIRMIVMDEGDLILSTGQKDTVLAILNQCPSCQRLCVSATYHAAIREWLPDVQADCAEEAAVRAEAVQYRIRTDSKYRTLLDLLAHTDITRTILFVSYKSTAYTLAQKLEKAGIPARDFSSRYEEKQRLAVLKEFREGSVRVLAATDAAARGLDIRGISHIIHYELPADYETYVHRSGRTAHQNSSGTVITLLDEEDMHTDLGKRICAESTEYVMDMSLRYDLSVPLPKESVPSVSVQKVIMKKGRKDKIRPRDILGALCTVLPFEEIGTIEIQDHSSMIIIRNTDPGLVEKLNGLSVKGRPVKFEHSRD